LRINFSEPVAREEKPMLRMPKFQELRQQKDMFEPDDDYYKEERESLY
jgi:hypothetical protein